MAADHDERTPAEELRDAERRLDGLIRFCEESVDDDGDLLVEAHLLAADLETIRGCVRAALSGSSERERLR